MSTKPLFVPTGSLMLDMALANERHGGYVGGSITNLIGDSHAGKSMVALSGLAWSANLPQFKDHGLYYDDAEKANNFNMTELFGKKAAARILAPERDHSGYIEDVHINIRKLADSGEPFVYVLDSLDACRVVEDEEYTDAQLKAFAAGKDTPGTYGMMKAKKIGNMLADLVDRINKQSALILISQTRDNVGPGYAESRRSGGRALKFYSSYEIWLAPLGAITKTVKGSTLNIGSKVGAKVKKNKRTGRVREVEQKIYYDYGVDDLESMVDFLVSVKRWPTPTKQTIDPSVDFELSPGMPSNIISKIDAMDGGIDRVTDAVYEEWMQREEAFNTHRTRKSKFA